MGGNDDWLVRAHACYSVFTVLSQYPTTACCLEYPFVNFASFSACDDAHDGFSRQVVGRGGGG